MRVPALVIAAVGIALGLLGCGGKSDAADAQQAVREIAKATSARDGTKLCGELLSRDFLEQSTGAKGSQAEQQCVRQVKQSRSGPFKLVRVTKTTLKGDSATVEAQVETQGIKRPQVFSLQKEDGRFKLVTGGAGTER